MMQDRLFTPQVVVLVMLSFVMGTSEFIVMGVLTDMSEDLGVPYATIGNLVSVFAIGYVVFTPLITALTGRYSRYRVLVCLSVLFLVANLWTFVSWDYVSLAVSRMLTAASSGALLSVGITFVMDLVTPRFRAAAVSWVYSGFSISSVIGVPLGTAMSHVLGWRSVFVLILVMGVVSATAAARLLPRLPAPEAVSTKRGGLGTMMRDSRVLIGAMVTVFGAMGYYVVYTYVTPILEDDIGVQPEMVSLVLMLLGVFLLAGNLLSGRVARHGGFRSMRFLYIVEALVLAALPFAVSAEPILGIPVLCGFCLMVYFMNAPVQMHLLEISSRDYPNSVTFASSLNPTSFNIGIAIGAFLGGTVYEASGLGSLTMLGVVCLVVAAVMCFSVCLVCRGEGRGTSVT